MKVNIGLEKDDKDTPIEINLRMPQIKDYLRMFFTSKYADDLKPEKEPILKDEILQNLNHILSKPTIKEILFDRLDVVKL